MYPNSFIINIIYTFTSGIWNKKILIQKQKKVRQAPWTPPMGVSQEQGSYNANMCTLASLVYEKVQRI